jgi:hypothetical protein
MFATEPLATEPRDPRYAVDLDIRIGFAPGRIVELSFGGALVETSEWLSLGYKCTLRLPAPAVQVPAFVVRSRLVRVDAATGRPIYQAGLRFDASPGIRQQLCGLIDALELERAEALALVCS